MSQLLFDVPRTKQKNPRRQGSRDEEASTIAVDGTLDRAMATARATLKPRAEDVRRSLAEATAADEDVTAGWDAVTLTEICDHAEHVDHVYLRSELARLWGLIATVVATYGDSHRHMFEVHRVYREFHRQVLTHVFREEHLLFADIRRIEQTRVRPFYASGIVSGMIQLLKREHQNMNRTLGRLRTLTRDYELPPNANNNYRSMLVGLRNLEMCVRQHMQNEDDILFARALAFEDSLIR